MVKINDTGGRVDNKNENKYSRTLNGWKRQQELDRIERENISVLRRLGKDALSPLSDIIWQNQFAEFV